MEKEIIVNGTKLTEGQSMTVRVALEEFYSGLRYKDCGEDRTGKLITSGYKNCVEKIREM